MFKKRSYNLLSLIVSILFIWTIGNIYVNAQTNLSAWDLIITTINADNPDFFEFMSRVDIETGTIIYFSDNARSWNNTRRTTEWNIKYTSPWLITAWTKIYFEGWFQTTYPTIWEMSWWFDISAAGDNIIVYQWNLYNDPTPNFLYGVWLGWPSTWIISGSPTANNSYLPAWLSLWNTAFSYNYDNIQYGCSNLWIWSSDFLSVVSDSANRLWDDTTRYTTTACTFDATKPQVFIDLASGQDDPTSATTVKFLVTFSEAINTSTFDCSDINLIWTAGTKTCTNISEIAPNDGTTFEVTATVTNNGIVIAEIEADKLTDINGNPNDIFSAVDNNIIIDQTPPVITIVNPNTDPALSKTISASTNEWTLTQTINAVWITTCDNSLIFLAYSDITFNTEADNWKFVCYRAIDDAWNTTYELSNTIAWIDTTPPVITRNGGAVINIEVGGIYTDLGATASDNHDWDITANITTVNPVNTSTVWIYTITYNVSDSLWNIANEVTRIVNVVDTTPPVITRLGDAVVSIEIGTPYTDAGATAFDNYDWDITASIVVVNPVNSSVAWNYTVTYNVVDANWNNATEVSRTVNVVDTTPPVITRLGDATVNIEVGTPYTDAGATALDNVDGDITASIITSNPVNSSVVWTYTVTYNVVDSSSNNAIEVSRTVHVVDTTPPAIILNGDSTVYIEFGNDYIELWATWSDNVDGTWDVTTIIWSVNTGVIWTYTITYYYTDSSLNIWSGVRTVIVQDTTPPSMYFLDSINLWPVQSDTISVYRDDAVIKKWMYDDDWACSTFAGDYPNNYIWDLTENTETNNGEYLCFYGEDSVWNKTTLASANPINIDITPPSYGWVVNGAYYNYDLNITYSDLNISGAKLNWLSLNSWDPVSLEDSYTLVISDLAGNTTTVNFVLDKTAPAIEWFTNMWYHNTDITINCSDSNLSWATVNWLPFTCGNTVSNEWIYNIFAEDLAGNYSTWQFTIDKVKPTATVEYNPDWPVWTNLNVVATVTGFDEVVVNINTPTNTFTDNWTFLFTFEDLAGNTGEVLANVDWIDKTAPTLEQAYISAWNTNTGNDWITNFYNWIINIRSDIVDNGGAWIDETSCMYTINWIDRNVANYDTGYCYANFLDPQTNISISFGVNDKAGNVWTWVNKQYLYDNIAPTTIDDANSTVRNIDQTVTLTANDTWVGIFNTFYCIDTNWTCTPSILWTTAFITGNIWEVTQKYVKYYSIDKLNNTESVKTSLPINIDKELPYITWTTTITSNNTNGLFAKAGDKISITFTSHEILLNNPTVNISGWGSMSFVSKIWNTYIYERNMNWADPEWIISINISMEDLATNVWTYTLNSSITYDRTPPAWISITQPTTHTYFQWGTNKTITRTTGSEINFWATPLVLQYSNDGWNTLHSTIIDWAPNNGSYNRTFPVVDSTLASVRIIATDLAGNVSYITWNNFTLDSTHPTIVSFTYPVWVVYFKWWSGYTITWTWGTDAFISQKVLEYLSGWVWTNIATYSTDVFEHLWITPNSGISANTWTIRLRITVYDRAWLNRTAETADFIIDSTMPSFNFSDTNSNWRNTNATWSTTTPTDNLAWIRSTGMLYRTDWPFTTNCDGWTSTIPVFTTEWIHTWHACVMDRAGNVRTRTQVYRIDKTAPIVTMPANIATNTWVTININVNWDISGIASYTWSKLSGPGTITFSSTNTQNPFVTANLDGNYVLQVVVRDNANNISTGTVNFVWSATAPVITTGAITNTTSSTPTFTFTATNSWVLSWSWPCSSATTTAISGNNTITLSSLANNTYSSCYARITDIMNNTGIWYNLPSFTVSYTPPSWGGGWGWGGGFFMPTCTNQDLTCGIYGKYILKSWVTCQWWDLWKSCGTDICVDGDYSLDPNDGICHDPTKVEANSGSTSTGKRETFKSPYNKELTDAYSYAFGVKITTVPNIERANLTGVLIRSHLSKMMSEYAMKVLWKTPDTSRKCVFKDMEDQTDEFKKYAKISCELWLMWLKTDWTPADIFNPNQEVTRAIFGTTLSRAIWGEKNNGWQNWYIKHLEDLKTNGVMNQIDWPNNREIRWYVMLMMMRADQKLKKSKYSNFESLRGKKVFVPNKKTSSTMTWTSQTNVNTNITTEKYSESEKEFIRTANKTYQFYEWYTAWQSNIWVRYLQYFLKENNYYTGEINGINTISTVAGLLDFQLKRQILADPNHAAAGFLWPATRNLINPLLVELLNK